MRLAAPEASLRVSIVVPAKDEEETVGAALDALSAQDGLSPAQFEVLLVLDGCTDSTAKIAAERAARHPDLRLRVLEGPDEGVGNARRLGMEVACERLTSVCRDGLIASTDADSVVSRDWVSAQISLQNAGAEAIGGRIELANGGSDLPPSVLRWYEEQGRERYARVLARYRGASDLSLQEHWQFSGASMSLTTSTYREIGGLDPGRTFEDEYLERELYRIGARIVRSTDVRVVTSARTSGRAERGLASDLGDLARESGDACTA